MVDVAVDIGLAEIGWFVGLHADEVFII